jgi:hypothetical protein
VVVTHPNGAVLRWRFFTDYELNREPPGVR